MESLVQSCDLEHALLQLLDELLLLVRAFLRKVCRRTDFLLPLLALVLQFREVLRQVPESLARGCLDLETFDLLQDVGSVHSLDDGIRIANHFFLENLSTLRENLFVEKQKVSHEWYADYI